MEQKELRLDKLTQIGGDRGLRIHYRPAYPFPLHAHEYYELEFIMEGTGKQWINGQERPVARGAVSLLTPADFHEVQPEPGTILWNISFDESFLPCPLPGTLISSYTHTVFMFKVFSKIVNASILHVPYIVDAVR